jgi:hypothetical protein
MNNSENNNETAAQDQLPVKAEPKALRPTVTSESSILLDSAKFEHLQRVAGLFSSGSLVPELYQKNPANCFIALHVADSLGIHPLMFMQNSFILKGKPGIEAKLVISLVNTRGPYPRGIQYEMKGSAETRSCRAYGVRADQSVDEFEVSFAQAKAAGWVDRNPNWKTLTDLMLKYRSSTYLARTYCPELLLGLQTREEIIDVDGVEVVTNPGSNKRSAVNDLFKEEK